MTLIAWGASEWYQGYEYAGQTAQLDEMLRWGADWLMKTHPRPNILYSQVGEQDTKEDYWGPDTDIPQERPSYSNRTTSVIAAATASALASTAYFYQQQLQNSTYALRLTRHAVQVFQLAQVLRKSENITTTSPYMTYSALWLYRLTGDQTYHGAAIKHFDYYGSDDPMAVAVYVLGSQVNGTDSESYKEAAEAYLESLLVHHADYTPGGLYIPEHDDTSACDTSRTCAAMHVAMIATLHDPVQHKKFTQQQLEYILGRNPNSMPYIVGVNADSPKNPRHAGAAGGANSEAFENDAYPTNYTLYGALVAGPDANDEFQDKRSAASFTSVRVTYNAAYQSLLAYQILQSAGDPPFTNTTSSPQDDMTRPPTPPWLIGLIVSVIIVLGILALAGVCYARRRKSQSQQRH
ncbi:Six-hairpin glycosidase-like protein [Syncephalastrum racemosum]|uniref:cellulase n=1 Tax=Syncephalastrum racemosum TaxID=13706 RepID=A0A1X2H5U1_SYNRA|nr:Six-hairpin glycosidase-like protein [Syncephalastrum racemosum]